MSEKIPVKLHRKRPLLQALLGPLLFILLFYLLDLPIDQILGLPFSSSILIHVLFGSVVGLIPGILLYRKCSLHNRKVKGIESIYKNNESDLAPQIELEALTDKMGSLITNEPELYWIGMLGSGFMVLIAIVSGLYVLIRNIGLMMTGAVSGSWIKSSLLLLIVMALGYFGCSLAGTLTEQTRHEKPIQVSVQYLQKHVKERNYRQAAKSLLFLEKEKTNPLFKTIARRARVVCEKIE